MTYKVPRTESQMRPRRRHAVGHARRPRGRLHLPGRRRLHVPHHAARHADGHAVRQRVSRNEQIDLSINGERVALLDDRLRDDRDRQERAEPDDAARSRQGRPAARHRPRSSRSSTAPIDDLVSPIDYTLADTEYGDNAGITMLPHVRDFSITGPFKVTGVSDTPSRRKMFICRPTDAAEEAPCAREDPARARDAGVPAAGEQRRCRVADEVLRRGAQGRTTSKRASRRALQAMLASPRVRVPPRRAAALTSRPGRPTASATSTSRRGCRSSSGTRCRTPSW